MSITRFLPILAILGLAACNTMEGMGEDVSTAGQTIQEEAAEAQ